ncbi:MAG: metal-dependent transcriptional regulator [Calditrichota bacterium]
MTKALSSPAEDCLLLIHRAAERGEPASTSGLARTLGVTDSTVTAMVQKLARLGHLNYRARKEISLSDSGQAAALKLIRRHRLIETFLWVHLGYSLAELHGEAENLEHTVSDKFVESIASLLGHPKYDPHGDPIPDQDGQIEVRAARPLPEAAVGQTVRLSRITITKEEVLRYLESIGLFVGKRMELVDIAPHGGVVRIRIGKVEHALDLETAQHLLIEDS